MKKQSLWLMVVTVLLLSAAALPSGRWNSCQWAAWAAELRDFGSDGSDGRSGREGREGRSGSSQSVTATGAPLNLDLAGEDGGDGENGESGERPWCASQPRDVRHDLQAADGGDGGDGGRGGNGGNGGDVLVYYADLAALRQISVNASGGRAGRGGSGGSGAWGCSCDRRDWTLQTCSGTPGAPDYSCRDERFVCRDGRYGNSGSFGADGQAGRPGQLRLVNQLDPLPPETPEIGLPLSELVGQPVTLSKNLWDERTGANALLAPGSTVADTYLAYRGRVEGRVQVIWQAPRAIADFSTIGVRAAIDDAGVPTLNFAEDVWLTGESSRSEALTTFTVTGAVLARNTTRLAWGTSQGRGRDLAMSVVDLGRESANLSTRFRLVLKTSSDDPRDTPSPRYSTRYDDWVPEELITRDGDRFVIAVGRLPVSQQTLRSGTPAQIELRAVRSLGSNSAEQVLSWQGQL